MSRPEPRFDKDYQYGRQGELWVFSIADAIVRDRVEVKRDRRFGETGNLYVELECWLRGGWQPSGLNTTESEIWAFVLGNTETTLFVPTAILRDIVQHLGRPAEERDGSHPTKGVLIKLSHLMAWLQSRQQRGAS